MPPLTGLGVLLGFGFYNDVAPMALGRGWFGIRFLQLFRADGAGVGLVWDWRSTMMSRLWRWGGIGLGSGFYNDFAPLALGIGCRVRQRQRREIFVASKAKTIPKLRQERHLRAMTGE